MPDSRVRTSLLGADGTEATYDAAAAGGGADAFGVAVGSVDAHCSWWGGVGWDGRFVVL